MDKIQKYIIKRGKRNAISRRFHAKDDEGAIATWKLVLDSMRHVLDVRYFTRLRRLLIYYSQTEPAISIVDIHHDDLTNTVASSVNHDTLKNQKEPDSPGLKVSITLALHATGQPLITT